MRSPVPEAAPDVHVVSTEAGKGVTTQREIGQGVEVLRFDGPIMPWHLVPEHEVRYVLMDATGHWVIPNPPARFINHSCAPNLRFTETRGAETIRPIAAGEELTISYDFLEPFDIERRRCHPDWYFWDDRWSFDCVCGAASCRRRVDKYRSSGDN